MLFSDRLEAGRELAARLEHVRDENPVVLGLIRGGVPVAGEVAEALEAPLDVCLVRKLGVPYEPEVALGAIGEDGVRVLNPEAILALRVTEEDLAAVERPERRVLAERARAYRGDRRPVDLHGRTVLIVDDGVATGSTARAACQVVRRQGAARVVFAAPVAPPDVTERLGKEVDELVCPYMPVEFMAVGQFYADFAQTTDEEVVECLDRAALRMARSQRRSENRSENQPADAHSSSPWPSPSRRRDDEVEVAAGGVALGGHLTVPVNAHGVVVFAHGSGSSRLSPRNQYVADGLNQARLGTLLFDLLTDVEEQDRTNVFDTELLAARLADATAWLRRERGLDTLPVGYFGASTGAAAALWAAAEPDADIAAVVSRGGRPDLAGPRLADVAAPTLLIVGGDDHLVLDLNRAAQEQLRCPNDLAVVPGATHLFAEPGALGAVTELARNWFLRQFQPR
ncbi:MAG: phosphoribosyltransferase [Streptomycetaceae bacterium]|nr:phosphoribosyltransferase [Streptomycetaceae bacterium]